MVFSSNLTYLSAGCNNAAHCVAWGSCGLLLYGSDANVIVCNPRTTVREFPEFLEFPEFPEFLEFSESPPFLLMCALLACFIVSEWIHEGRIAGVQGVQIASPPHCTSKLCEMDQRLDEPFW